MRIVGLWRTGPYSPLLVFLLHSLLPLIRPSNAGNQNIPRLQLSHAELRSRNSSAVFWDGGEGGAYQALLLDEDRGWLLVGGRDHIYMLNSDSFTQPARKIHWPAGQEHTERCKYAGKNLSMDCANYVRLLQPFNKTHVYVCGTGAFHPQCTYIDLGHNLEKPTFRLLSQIGESGRGKCPFSPQEPFTARLTDGDLYAGTSVDFMGTNAAIFRTSVHSSNQHYIRTEAYQDQWLNEPEFVGSYSIPDTHSLDDDKVYFFFKETAVESNQLDKRIYSRVARVCKNDIGGKRSLINRWSTFLKARLVCSVPGPGGMDTHFDKLEDIFLLETKEPQNPVIYGVFSTSSSVFKGSAVCVYTMTSIRAAFNGPFAHKESPDYRWMEYKGKIPYPRPGTCPSETYDPLHKSTRDFPDDVVSFMRTHQLMWEPVMPIHRRPVFTRINTPYRLKKLVVDRVDAEDGQYDVLHLGTDDGRVLKVVSVPKENWETEEIILEELNVFKTQTTILSMELSTKRQVLFVSSDEGVVQLPVQRCELYGKACVDCCLARDPYCAWDGSSCTNYFPSNKRRARRQDVRYGDPWSQCQDMRDGSENAELKTVYAVETNSTFLECVPRSPQATIKWIIQPNHSQTSKELVPGEENLIHMQRGLLLQHLASANAGLYLCVAYEHSFSRTLARYELHVIPQNHMPKAQNTNPGNYAALPRSYKELHLMGVSGLTADEYCEQLWYREKRRQQKLRTLKWKQVSENRKARVRRQNPPNGPLDGGETADF
ncbi:semaphorin-3D-like [Sinocyclocheilus rhinocerous]|uniref:Semaphorin-3D-like n=1 Tax=Sinocyclocheilus rhinocerous TaxID=307959 RepID=A0A673HNF6_9TELE|nr:PREDICTED: semaphorin-3D-like [Sinocyclocheilus rhinocerous]XP_016382978.1 PREDICTED: semaphorin-3D-like [Sinocyclocheilus rhinocerous]XP_016382979.1 PREDICTED: semaphorin-3D-like [Sinocyclocheilus rhinocerous]